MRNTILVFGLIAGAIMSLIMLATMPFHDRIGFDRGMIIGYASMVLAFLMIFAGVRSYRDNVAGGSITFGRAFTVGALIALVASLCYVATWQVMYYGGFSSVGGAEYMEKYQAHSLAKMRAKGDSQETIDRKVAEMQRFAEMYRNPAVNAAVTLIEPLPVGLALALVAAGILRRKRQDAESPPIGALAR